VFVEATLNGLPDAYYRIEVYAARDAAQIEVSGTPFIVSEGQQLIRTIIVQANSRGLAVSQFTVPPGQLPPCVLTDETGSTPTRACLTATATRIVDATGTLRSTSEFGSALILTD
jgi:hypothetical protein